MRVRVEFSGRQQKLAGGYSLGADGAWLLSSSHHYYTSLLLRYFVHFVTWLVINLQHDHHHHHDHLQHDHRHRRRPRRH